MTVTIQRKLLTAEQRQLIKDAVLTGAPMTRNDDPEITDQILSIAEQLPEYLKKAGMSDSSENRSRLLDMILAANSIPRGRKPRPGWYRRHR